MELKEFKPDEIVEACCTSMLIYKDNPEFAPGAHLILVGKWFINQTEMGLYYDEYDKTVYVAYRGSSSSKDWIRDFSIFSKVWNGVKVHRGFLKAYEQVRDQGICERLDLMLKNKTVEKIIFTGHSLGGAVAQLHFYDFTKRMKFYEDCNTYSVRSITFGSPRVYIEDSFDDKDFEIYLKERHLRIKNSADVVTNMPPRFKIFGNAYFHLGRLLQLGKLDFIDGVVDHFRRKYLDAVVEAMNNIDLEKEEK